MKMDVFIGFDEDDDNDHKIDLNQLFGVDAGTKPYCVEVSIFGWIIVVGKRACAL